VVVSPSNHRNHQFLASSMLLSLTGESGRGCPSRGNRGGAMQLLRERCTAVSPGNAAAGGVPAPEAPQGGLHCSPEQLVRAVRPRGPRRADVRAGAPAHPPPSWECTSEGAHFPCVGGSSDDNGLPRLHIKCVYLVGEQQRRGTFQKKKLCYVSLKSFLLVLISI
jgi:hypothetical protein